MRTVDRPTPYWTDDRREFVARVTDRWVICMVPMFFNERICIATHDEYGSSWTAGYCYEKNGLALAVSCAWNPEHEQRPPLFKKIAFDFRPLAEISQQQILCQFCATETHLSLPEVDHDLGSRVMSATIDNACAICGSREDPSRTFGFYDVTDEMRPLLRLPRGTVAREET